MTQNKLQEINVRTDTRGQKGLRGRRSRDVSQQKLPDNSHVSTLASHLFSFQLVETGSANSKFCLIFPNVHKGWRWLSSNCTHSYLILLFSRTRTGFCLSGVSPPLSPPSALVHACHPSAERHSSAHAFLVPLGELFLPSECITGPRSAAGLLAHS